MFCKKLTNRVFCVWQWPLSVSPFCCVRHLPQVNIVWSLGQNLSQKKHEPHIYPKYAHALRDCSAFLKSSQSSILCQVHPNLLPALSLQMKHRPILISGPLKPQRHIWIISWTNLVHLISARQGLGLIKCSARRTVITHRCRFLVSDLCSRLSAAQFLTTAQWVFVDCSYISLARS